MQARPASSWIPVPSQPCRRGVSQDPLSCARTHAHIHTRAHTRACTHTRSHTLLEQSVQSMTGCDSTCDGAGRSVCSVWGHRLHIVLPSCIPLVCAHAAASVHKRVCAHAPCFIYARTIVCVHTVLHARTGARAGALNATLHVRVVRART